MKKLVFNASIILFFALSAKVIGQIEIISNGNIGLGTSSPQKKLHTVVTGVTNAHYMDYTVGVLENVDSKLQLISEDVGNAASQIVLSTAPASGNNKHWGIHHTGPNRSNRLEIGYGTSSASGNFWDLPSKMVFTTSGTVGIGTIPGNKLHVYGSSVQFDYINNPIIFNVYHANPRICSDTKVVFYTYQSPWDRIDIECKTVHEYSDSLAKTNLKKVEKSIDKLKEINGYTYNWKTDINGPKHAGLLAQQVERVIPEAVSTCDSTNQKTLAYSHIIPYLVEAIKEQQVMIENLQEEINGLKAVKNKE